jgi:hypothetical protein
LLEVLGTNLDSVGVYLPWSFSNLVAPMTRVTFLFDNSRNKYLPITVTLHWDNTTVDTFDDLVKRQKGIAKLSQGILF